MSRPSYGSVVEPVVGRLRIRSKRPAALDYGSVVRDGTSAPVDARPRPLGRGSRRTAHDVEPASESVVVRGARGPSRVAHGPAQIASSAPAAASSISAVRPAAIALPASRTT